MREPTMDPHAKYDYAAKQGAPVLPMGQKMNWQGPLVCFIAGVALASLAAIAVSKMRKQPLPAPAVDILPMPEVETCVIPSLLAPAPIPVAQPKAFEIHGERFVDTEQLTLVNEGWLWASGDYTVQMTERNFDTVNLHQHWNDGGVFRTQAATIRMDNAAEVVANWKPDDVITQIGENQFSLLKNGQLVQTFEGEISIIPDTTRIIY